MTFACLWTLNISSFVWIHKFTYSFWINYGGSIFTLENYFFVNSIIDEKWFVIFIVQRKSVFINTTDTFSFNFNWQIGKVNPYYYYTATFSLLPWFYTMQFVVFIIILPRYSLFLRFWVIYFKNNFLCKCKACFISGYSLDSVTTLILNWKL